MAVMSPELRAWLKPGTAGMIATVGATGQPELARVWGFRLDHEPDVVEVYVQRSSAVAVLESLAGGGRAAVNAIEVLTYVSRTFKGTCTLSEGAIDEAFLAQSLEAINRVFHAVGLPVDAVERILAHGGAPRAMVGLRVVVDSVFDQSPRPGAGGRL